MNNELTVCSGCGCRNPAMKLVDDSSGFFPVKHVRFLFAASAAAGAFCVFHFPGRLFRRSEAEAKMAVREDEKRSWGYSITPNFCDNVTF